MTSNSKQDKTKLRKIISDNVQFTAESPMKLLIYYRNRKLSSLLIKHNSNNNSSEIHVVYKYNYPENECQHSQFHIGHTTTALNQRMTTYLLN